MAKNQQKPVIRRLLNGEFDKQYEGVCDAARDNGGIDCASNISRACRKGSTHRGYRFEFADKQPQTIDFPHVTSLPNVLVLDVETSPLTVFVWGLYKQRISYENIVEEWNIISWAAKWLHEDEVHSDCVSPKEAVNRDDKRIMLSLWDYLERADIIIAHNAKRFDIRKINARLITNGIKQPSPYQIIDTLTTAQRNFAFASHRLNYLSQLLVREEKLDTDFGLWRRCVNGEKEALDYMEEYNRQDVIILEDVYVELRGWIKSHPNLALYIETEQVVCPNCMSEDMEQVRDYVTAASKFDAYRCKNCGAISRMRKSNVTPKERDKLRISVAR